MWFHDQCATYIVGRRPHMCPRGDHETNDNLERMSGAYADPHLRTYQQSVRWSMRDASPSSTRVASSTGCKLLLWCGCASSEALAVHDRWSRLVILLLGDPHLLEGRERREDGAADPH